jgi:tRNA A37 threonylcarbamoyltransferase TsaD
MTRSLVTLAIETSCDDTAVAILEQTDSSSSSSSSSSASNRTTTTLHFNERISSDSREFKGIKPSVATRGHNESLAKLIKRAIPYLPKHASKPDFVCTTRGPGINPNLNIGLSTGKGLAVAWDVPFVGVHHMQAHALTPRLVRALGMPMATSTSTTTSTSTLKPTTPSGPDFPFLSLLVSGGHTQLVHSASLTEHHIIATTGDTAIGNILDQTARVILPPSVLDASPDVMYGRILENYAFPDPTPDVYSSFFTPASSRAEELVDVPSGYSWTLALPFRQSRRLAYSFSSFYTNVHKIAAAAAAAEEEEGKPPMDDAERRTLARHTMRAAFQHLASRLCLALEDVPHLREASTLVVAGGVASNRFLMHVLRTTLDARGFGHMEILAPPIALCTDNAAMIAWAGMEMYRAGWHTDLSVMPITRWPLDPDAGEKTGLLGVDGWLKRDLTE